jgi:ribosome-associated protein
MQYKETNSKLLCDTIVEGMQENKAKDIVVLDLRDISSAVADFFVICTGDSSTHIDGITSSLIRYTRNNIKERPWHVEGKGINEWVLIDYASVVAHVFYPSTRDFYDLEDLWADAKRVDVPNLN